MSNDNTLFYVIILIGVEIMASTKDYKDYILEQLSLLDDRLLVKKVDDNIKYEMEEVIPYKNAKPMYLVDDVDNQDTLKRIIYDTCEGLKEK